ncbi:hypothetical protein AVEN_190051-1 [Araneus ventricosus]|uniref:Uncharacterized protein n=1 Tax=Araneus ventricosus TaxID=182803 RepID=A0A4Y2VL36_ARAVE|nr:hypothetical protein AVEN_190051-1 [Araneus ventricosus]
MSTLNDCPKIAKSLKTSGNNQVQLLHRRIFGSVGDKQNRSRLRNFSGFPSDFQLEKTKEKVLKEFLLKDLIAICNPLHLEFFTNAEKCCDIIVTNLSDLSLLKTELSYFSETDDLKELESKLDLQQTASGKLILESRNEHRKSQIVFDESFSTFIAFTSYATNCR